jgi:3-deoxy-D-manno-octulosonic-acid transferase
LPPFLALYQRLSSLLKRVVVVYAYRRLRRSKEDPARLHERFGQPSQSRPKGSIVWLHGASVGESISLLPLLYRIQTQFPHVTPLVTTGTVTGATVMARLLPKGCIHQYIPLDVLPWVGSFLDYWQPNVGIFIESEFWPNLIASSRDRNIPLYLVNADLSEKSCQSWSRFPSVIRYLLSCFEAILAQSEISATRLKALGAPPSQIHVPGNLKFSAPPLPYDTEEWTSLKSSIQGRPVWVASNTHPGEETIVAAVHNQVKKTLPNILTLLVPRHPHRGEEIINDLRSKGLNVARRSCGETIQPTTDIYLADTIGELGIFYRLSEIAFIGGTFAPIGGHSPIEAALLECVVLWGPDIHNFIDICRILDPCGFSVTSPEIFAATVERLLTDEKLRNEKIQTTQGILEKQAGVLDRIMKVLQPALERKEVESLSKSIST